MKNKTLSAVLALVLVFSMLSPGTGITAMADNVSDGLPVNSQFYIYDDYGQLIPCTPEQENSEAQSVSYSASINFGGPYGYYVETPTVGTLRQNGAEIVVPYGYYIEKAYLVSNGVQFSGGDSSIVKYATADKYSANVTFESNVFTDSFSWSNPGAVIFSDKSGYDTTCYTFEVVLKKLDSSAVLKYRDGLFSLGSLSPVTNASDRIDFYPTSGFSHWVSGLYDGNYEAARTTYGKSFTGWQLEYENGSTVTVYTGEEIRPYGNCTIFAMWDDCEIITEPEPVVTPEPEPVVISDPEPVYEIQKIDLGVSPADVYGVYNGTAYAPTQYIVTYGYLNDGDYLAMNFYGSLTTAGTVESGISEIRVYNGEYDVTDNYNITTGTGIINVDRRDITISPVSIETEYAGVPVYPGDFTTSEVPEGTYVDVVLGGCVDGPGYAEITCEAVSIYSYGEDVTGSYNIYCQPAYINVTEPEIVKTAISVSPADVYGVYNGTTYVPTQYVITSGYLNDGDYLAMNFYGSLTTAGTVESGISEIRVYNGENDVTGNYDITTGTGTITVDKRDITISASSITVEYAGAPVYPGDYTFSEVPEGTTVDVTLSGYVDGPGYADITYDSVSISCYGEDVTGSYNIYCQPASITVTEPEIVKTAISVSPADVYGIYNGTAYVPTQYVITSGCLNDGDYLAMNFYGSLTTAGSIESGITDIRVYNGENDVTGNYDITTGTGTITVDKRDITISAVSIETVYAGEPVYAGDYTVSEVPEGTTVDVTLGGYVDGPGYAEITYDEVKITCNGDDVTGCYNIYCQPAYINVAEPEIVKTPITIAPADISGEYNAEALVPVSYVVTSGELSDGDVPVIEYYGSQTEAGSSESGISSIRIENNGTDVTKNYEITTGTGTITVTKAELTITALPVNAVYNREPVGPGDYTVSEVPEGTDVDVVLSGLVDGPGTAEIELESYSISFEGKDVTDSYNVTYVPASIVVTVPEKVAITLVPENVSREYDGTALVPTEYKQTSGELYAGDTLVVELGGSQTTVGVSDSEIKSVKVMNGENDVTEFYAITCEKGSIEITKRSVTITALPVNVVYTGSPVGPNGFTHSEVPEGTTVDVTLGGSITDPGTKEITFDSIKITYGGEDVTFCYNIIKVPATITVSEPEKTPLVIVPVDVSREYDGTALVPTEYKIVSGALRAGDTLSVEFSGSLTDCGTVESSISSVKLTNNGSDVSSFYSLSLGNGHITVTKRTLTLTADSATRVENGTPLSLNSFAITSGTLVHGHTLTGQTTGSISQPGTVDNVIIKSSLRIVDSSNKEVSGNYNLILLPGKLTITASSVTPPPEGTKTNITVKAPVMSKVYDGTALDISNVASTVTYGTLPAGYKLLVSYDNTSILNAGSVTVHITAVRVVDQNGADVTSGYNITREDGSLEITRRSLVIKTGSATRAANGKALTEYSATATGKLDGHYVYVKFTGSQTNVGSSYNTVDEKSVKVYYEDKNNNNAQVVVTNNYNITFEYGTLTVTQSGSNSGSGSSTNPNVPATGDTANIGLWIGLMVAVVVIGAAVAIIVVKFTRANKVEKSETAAPRHTASSGGRHSKH